MKKNYEKPVMVCESFKVDEYCSTCGDVEKKYYFTCDEDPGYVRWVYNSDGSLRSTSYNACGTKHELTEAEVEGLINGFVVKHVEGSNNWLDRVPVLIWTGENKDNCHCTTNVNVDSWQVNLS